MKTTIITLLVVIAGGLVAYFFTPYQTVWMASEPLTPDVPCADTTEACVYGVHSFAQETLSNYDLQRYKGQYVLTLP